MFQCFITKPFFFSFLTFCFTSCVVFFFFGLLEAAVKCPNALPTEMARLWEYFVFIFYFSSLFFTKLGADYANDRKIKYVCI